VQPQSEGRQPSHRGTGKVVHREYYGHDCVLLVETQQNQLIRVRCSGRAPVQVGDSVSIAAAGAVVAWPDEAPGTF